MLLTAGILRKAGSTGGRTCCCCCCWSANNDWNGELKKVNGVTLGDLVGMKPGGAGGGGLVAAG